jgi:hypothetical protein
MATIQTLRNQSDTEALRARIACLAGLPCWKAFTSFGNQAMLYLGGKVPYESKKLTGTKGEWVFNVLGADWAIRDSSGQDAAIEAIQGAAIASIDLLANLGIVLSFDNGCVLAATPTEEDEQDEVPHWQVLSALGWCLVVGPGRQWSILRSDEAY